MPGSKEIFIPDFLGGVRYDIEETQLEVNQLSQMSNLYTSLVPPVNSATALDKVPKLGLRTRGTLRKINTATYGSDSYARHTSIAEVKRFYSTNTPVKYRTNDHLMTMGQQLNANGTIKVLSLEANYGDLATTNPYSQVSFKTSTSTSIMATNSPVVYHSGVIEVPGNKIISYFSNEWSSDEESTIIYRDNTNYAIVPTFHDDGLVTLTSGSTTILGTGTNFTNLESPVNSRLYIQVHNSTDERWATDDVSIAGADGWRRISTINNATNAQFVIGYTGVTRTDALYRISRATPYNPLGISYITALNHHKFRTFIGSFDSDQSLLYVSEAADPTDVRATNVFRVGDESTKILQLVSSGDFNAVIKEDSIYGFYLNSVNPPGSTIVNFHNYLGGMNSYSSVFTAQGLVVLTQMDGIYLLTGKGLIPICKQLRGKFRSRDSNIKDTVISYSGEKLIIAIPNLEGSTVTPVYYYDIEKDSLERQDYSKVTDTTSRIVLAPGTRSGNRRMKLSLGNGNIYEENHFKNANLASSVFYETAVTASFTTKRFLLGEDKYDGILQHAILDWDAPTVGQTVTLTCNLDGTTAADRTITATATGFNRSKIDFPPDTYRGQGVTFKFATTHDLASGTTPIAFYNFRAIYDQITRIT